MTESEGSVREFPLPPGFRPPAAPADDVPLRRAATVMLVRPAVSPQAGGLEVFTFRRRAAMAFAAGMLVFPGGAVEPEDGADRPWTGPPPAALAAALGCDEDAAVAVVAAAVRETFEECGVRLAADVLHPWARWVTPAGESRRFDTWFFAARLPAGQIARDLGGEGERAAWRVPSQVLAEYRAGRTPMLPPTVVAMEELAAAGSVEALLATPRRLRPVSPWPVVLPPGPDGEPRRAVRVHLDGHGGGEPGPPPAGPGARR